jgi:hypothetical protein
MPGENFHGGKDFKCNTPAALSITLICLIQIRNDLLQGLGPILTHGGRKQFSCTLLVVVEGRPFSSYIYVGRAAT